MPFNPSKSRSVVLSFVPKTVRFQYQIHEDHNPYFSSKPNQTSFIVGNDIQKNNSDLKNYCEN